MPGWNAGVVAAVRAREAARHVTCRPSRSPSRRSSTLLQMLRNGVSLMNWGNENVVSNLAILDRATVTYIDPEEEL